METDKSHYLRLFGLQVRELRKESGLSQEKLAELSGLDRSYLGGIERGEHNLALLNIIKLYTALEVQPSDLFKQLTTKKEK
jgi:transcriptional regulator with XRE-family HTH domain